MKYSRLLSKIYRNVKSSASYSSVNALYKEAKKHEPDIKLSDVKLWLSGQDAYTLHKPARKKFKRNRIYVSTIDSQWEIDLADLSSIKEHNDGYTFLLTCIDVSSKFAWVEPLKRKSVTSICEAFNRILSTGRKPWKLRSDKGKEFINKDFQKLLKTQSIDFFTSQNEDIKCAVLKDLTEL